MADSKILRFVTMGCSKNLVDSEKLAAYFPSSKFRIEFEHSNGFADYLLLNTCGFIQDAKEESVQAILEAVELKKKKKIAKVIVWGCLSQRYMKEMREEIPEVDFWAGTESFPAVAGYIMKKDYTHNPADRILSTPSHYAYLKISEGCNRLCSFCAIPLIRGKYRSFPISLLVKEARLLAKKGVKELILIAQDLTYYGTDSNGKQQLTRLVQQLSAISGIEWIRLHYLYPQRFPDDLLLEIRDNPKVCKYIDVPVQHISNRILKQMKRGIKTDETYALISRIRKIIPDVTLRTTVMVGFPGETEEEFSELLEMIEKVRFDRLGAFAYSHEDSTYAGMHLKDNVSENIKMKRLHQVMELQREISAEKNEAMTGKKIRVLIDGKEGRYFTARPQSDSPEVDNCVLIHANYLTIGDFADVRIVRADDYQIYGKLC